MGSGHAVEHQSACSAHCSQTKINPEQSQLSTQLYCTAAEWGGELK